MSTIDGEVQAALKGAVNDAYRLGIGQAIRALEADAVMPWTDDERRVVRYCIGRLRELSLLAGEWS